VKSNKVVVIDIGVGNVKSVANMLRKIGLAPEIASNPDESNSTSLYVLPGVGAFDQGMRLLSEKGWDSFLISTAEREVPILGLCLGMQLLCEGSEEGVLPGLGIIPGRFTRFPGLLQDGSVQKVPHMGWNTVDFVGPATSWNAEHSDQSRFYFVHSYFYEDINSSVAIGRTIYGQPFVSAINQGPVTGLQFHPEKSHRHGMQLLSKIATESGAEI
jgi:imidazole glycerol-phosphate synthase subunit HisH